MLVIRLTRVGKKNSPAYRVVVADKRRAVKRKFLEIVGNYNPTTKPKQLVINKERALFWMGNGAQPSDTVRNLMCDQGILDKKEKVNKVYGKAQTKKAIKEGPKEEKTAAPEAESQAETAETPETETASKTEEAAETEEDIDEATTTEENATEAEEQVEETEKEPEMK